MSAACCESFARTETFKILKDFKNGNYFRLQQLPSENKPRACAPNKTLQLNQKATFDLRCLNSQKVGRGEP